MTLNSTTNAFATLKKFIRPIDLAAGGAASTFSQSVVSPGQDSHIDFRYHQFNSVIKNFKFSDQRGFVLLLNIFNLANRANFGVPIRSLEASGFGQATNTVTPSRRLQVGAKFTF